MWRSRRLACRHPPRAGRAAWWWRPSLHPSPQCRKRDGTTGQQPAGARWDGFSAGPPWGVVLEEPDAAPLSYAATIRFFLAAFFLRHQRLITGERSKVIVPLIAAIKSATSSKMGLYPRDSSYPPLMLILIVRSSTANFLTGNPPPGSRTTPTVR